MLRKVLAVFGPLGFGFSLWVSAQRFPDLFGRFAKFLQYFGDVLMLLAPVLIVMFWVKAKNAQITRLSTENRGLREQLSWRDTEKAGNAVSRCRHLWQGNDAREIALSNYEDDPVYLQLLLDQQLSKIVAQPIVQRLNHIKQLSFAYLTFRSATHTRLAHSLGACRNAELVMRKVFQEGHLYSRTGKERIDLTEPEKTRYVRLAMVAALVHDLGHGPLSHALEIHLKYGEEGKAKLSRL